jgi:hypothetical protein
VPIRPVCEEGGIPGGDSAELRSIEGELATAYADIFASRFPTYIVRHHGYDVTVFVTVARALDRTGLKTQTALAVHDLLQQRLGEAAYRDWLAGRVSVGGFTNEQFTTNCELIRKFALARGMVKRRAPANSDQ